MVDGNHQCNAAILNQNKAQFQWELSLAQFSPSLLLLLSVKIFFNSFKLMAVAQTLTFLP